MPAELKTKNQQPKKHSSLSSVLLSRRTVIKGAAASAASIAAISLLPGCKHKAPSTEAGAPAIIQESAGIDILKTFKEAKNTLQESGSWDLPAQTVLMPSQGTWIAALTPGKTPAIVNAGNLFSLSSGKLFPCLEAPVSTGANWVIYALAASDSVFAWIELQIFTRAWKLYAQSHKNGSLTGKISKLWESSPNYEPSSPICFNDQVIWQVMPTATGSKRTEASYCYVWSLGSSKARALVESQGRFASNPEISGNTLILCPRAQSKNGVFYALSAYTLQEESNKKPLASLVLPQGVRPLYASYFGKDFVFSIEASYQGRGLLGKLGTYIGHKESSFLTLVREPFAPVSGTVSGLYIIKTRASYFVIDTKKKEWSTLSAADRSMDYGEYPARSGISSDFVTYSTIKSLDSGAPASVRVRRFVF